MKTSLISVFTSMFVQLNPNFLGTSILMWAKADFSLTSVFGKKISKWCFFRIQRACVEELGLIEGLT